MVIEQAMGMPKGRGTGLDFFSNLSRKRKPPASSQTDSFAATSAMLQLRPLLNSA